MEFTKHTARRLYVACCCDKNIVPRPLAGYLINQTRSLVSHASPGVRRWTSKGSYSLWPKGRCTSNSRCLSVLSSSPLISCKSSVTRNSRYPQSPIYQRRYASTWLPEALSNFSIWGGSGWMLKTLHMDGLIPYWACFAIINVLVRCLLFPLVLHGAHTSARFGKVLPEVQFLISLFTKDWNDMKKRNAPLIERWALMRTNFQSLGAIYKLNKIRPFAVFLSPLVQLPFFWYVSVDLRKIVNGLDPQLAQALVESPVAWIPDLTEADPWYGLPVLAGALLYANVEVAVGKQSLAGPSTAKADTGILFKDLFQSFAVFMPCFASQMPAGIQIYLATSFFFTMGQSASLRNATFRSMVGLPPMPVARDGSMGPKVAQQLIQLKQLEQKAREIRGDGPLLGKGILAVGFECSFPGAYRKSTIEVQKTEKSSTSAQHVKPIELVPLKRGTIQNIDLSSLPLTQLPYIHGVSAPPWQLAEQKHLFEPPPSESNTTTSSAETVPDFSDEIMAKANRGEMPVATKIMDPTKTIKKKPTIRTPVRVNRKPKGTKKR